MLKKVYWENVAHFVLALCDLIQGLSNVFLVKVQRVNILSFAQPTIYVTTKLCHCSILAVVSTQMNERGYVPVNLHWQKQAVACGP